MLIVMAGLIGSGKSFLARRLAERLPAVILNKDVVRPALFPGDALEYSLAQNDFVMNVVYQAAEYILSHHPEKHVIIDGRPYVHAYQVDDLKTYFERAGMALQIIECICPPELARERLERDTALGAHPAADRHYPMYLKQAASADPIPPPKLVVDTSLEIESCIADCLAYLGVPTR